MAEVKIFISYSHVDMEWKNWLVKHLKVLELEDYYKLWDDRQIEVGDEWEAEIETALNDAQIIVMLISANFLTSQFIRNKEIPITLERKKKEGIRVIPVIVKPCAWEKVNWLEKFEVFPEDGKALSRRNNHETDHTLKCLAEKISCIKNISNNFTSTAQFSPPHPNDISLRMLPSTGSNFLGRQKELEKLNMAWNDEHTRIISLIGWGGMGKSSIVNRWLNIMNWCQYGGANKVYGWSFHSQGADEEQHPPVDEFLRETLDFFGDPDPSEGSHVEKSKRLVKLIQKEKTLLILDGLEPLQHPPGDIQGLCGKVKDRSIRNLLKELSVKLQGLCIITSREEVSDLSTGIGYTVSEIKMENLSEEEGTALLKSLGVKGNQREIAKAVKEFGGHALALTLLGRYIKSVYNGDIRERDRIPTLLKQKNYDSHYAKRMISAYEKQLKNTPELNILRLMGLFDRPVQREAIDALKEEPPIPGITDQLQELEEDEWQWALSTLRDANILSRPNPKNPDSLDCHALFREYFGQKLKKNYPESWKEAHKRLYEFYKEIPESELPDTLREMEPLFAAVVHGCAAGLHQEALDDVYYKRIRREDEAYNVKKLGAYSIDLSLLSHFFDTPWSKPAKGLSEDAKSCLLNWTEFRLRAVGRVKEALQPIKESLKTALEQEDAEGAVVGSSSLSEIKLILGDINKATQYAKECDEYAVKDNLTEMRKSTLASLAAVLHHGGKIEESKKLFIEAEATQKDHEKKYTILYSIRGYQFCSLLLDLGQYQEVTERANKTLKWLIEYEKDDPLSIALDKLSLGRAWMMKTQSNNENDNNDNDNDNDYSLAMDYLNQAVNELTAKGHQEYLFTAFLTRAECYRYQKEAKKARKDLDEAKSIAAFGGMQLYICDYHIEAARLCLSTGKEREAERRFKIAAQMVKEMGYWRRKEDVQKWL